MTTTVETLSERLWTLRDEIKRLSKQIRKSERGSDREAELLTRRRALDEELLSQVFEYLAEEDEAFTPASDLVLEDLGVVSFMAQVMMRVREQIERELARDDLTPYMWSIMHKRLEGVNVALGVLGGKRARNVEIEPQPSHLLYAEYDDGTIDFAEADDREEADRIEQAWVDEGAIVYRYRALPEMGESVPLFEPVMPIDNRQRPISQPKYERLVRLKGNDRFNLPDELREFVIQPHGARYDDD